MRLRAARVEAPLIYDGEYSTSDWERYFRKLNANMSRGWNAFMHNGVQLYVPDVQSIIDKMKEDGQPFMARSSGAEGEFTHVMFEGDGPRVWELVGATNAQGQAPYPRFGEAECGPAHMVRHPSPSALNDAWSLSGAFDDRTGCSSRCSCARPSRRPTPRRRRACTSSRCTR